MLENHWLWRVWKFVFQSRIGDYELCKFNQALISLGLFYSESMNVASYSPVFSQMYLPSLPALVCALRMCCLLLTALPGPPCHLASGWLSTGSEGGEKKAQNNSAFSHCFSTTFLAAAGWSLVLGSNFPWGSGNTVSTTYLLGTRESNSFLLAWNLMSTVCTKSLMNCKALSGKHRLSN